MTILSSRLDIDSVREYPPVLYIQKDGCVVIKALYIM